MKDSVRRYILTFSSAMGGFVFLMVVRGLFVRFYPGSDWVVFLAVAPVLPLVFAAIAVARFIRSMDELQRQKQLEALIFAYTTSILLTLAYGLLEGEVLPPLNWIWAASLMIVLILPGQLLAWRRYR